MTSRDVTSAAARAFVARSYERFSPELRRYLRRRVRDRQDVWDLAQEVWRRLLRIQNPSEVAEPLAYLYRAAANVVAEYHLTRRRDCVSVDSDAAEHALENPAEVLPNELEDQLARQAALDRIVIQLPRTYREILLRRLSDGQSFAEIAEALNLTAGTAERYFSRAMMLVRKQRREESTRKGP